MFLGKIDEINMNDVKEGLASYKEKLTKAEYELLDEVVNNYNVTILEKVVTDEFAKKRREILTSYNDVASRRYWREIENYIDAIAMEYAKCSERLYGTHYQNSNYFRVRGFILNGKLYHLGRQYQPLLEVVDGCAVWDR